MSQGRAGLNTNCIPRSIVLVESPNKRKMNIICTLVKQVQNCNAVLRHNSSYVLRGSTSRSALLSIAL